MDKCPTHGPGTMLLALRPALSLAGAEPCRPSQIQTARGAHGAWGWQFMIVPGECPGKAVACWCACTGAQGVKAYPLLQHCTRLGEAADS